MKKTSSEWTQNRKPQFKVSYQGSADYILADGRKVTVRTFANPRANYNTGVYAGEIEPFVGTVRFTHHPDFNTMPGPDVLQHFPGFIGARFLEDWTVEYSEPRGLLVFDPVTEYVYAGPQLLADTESPYSREIMARGHAMRPLQLSHWQVQRAHDPERPTDFWGPKAQVDATEYANRGGRGPSDFGYTLEIVQLQ